MTARDSHNFAVTLRLILQQLKEQAKVLEQNTVSLHALIDVLKHQNPRLESDLDKAASRGAFLELSQRYDANYKLIERLILDLGG